MSMSAGCIMYMCRDSVNVLSFTIFTSNSSLKGSSTIMELVSYRLLVTGSCYDTVTFAPHFGLREYCSSA